MAQDDQFWRDKRAEAQRELLDAAMESVALIGEYYRRGEYTPEIQKMVYERERARTRFLKDDIDYCNRALMGEI